MNWQWVEHGFALLGVLSWLAGIFFFAACACDEEDWKSPVHQFRTPFRQIAAVGIFICWPIYIFVLVAVCSWEWIRCKVWR